MKKHYYTASEYDEYMKVQENRSRKYVKTINKYNTNWFESVTELPLYSRIDFSGVTTTYQNYCLESKIREVSLDKFKHQYKTVYIEIEKYNALMDAYNNEDYEALPLYINFLNDSNLEFLFINLSKVPKNKLIYWKGDVKMKKTGKVCKDVERWEIPIEFFNYYVFDKKNRKYMKKNIN